MARPNVREAYVPEDIDFPFRGLNTQSPSKRMPPGFSPSNLNIDFGDLYAKGRGGLSRLGDAHPSDIAGTVRGNPIRALIDFEDTAGTRRLLAITNKHQFRFDTALDDWVDITKQKATPIAINAVSTGSKTFTHNGSDDRSDFVAGKLINVAGSTGNNGIYTIASSAFTGGNTVITVTQAIPNATADGTMAADDEWTATNDDQVDWTIGVDTSLGRVVIITNNVDKPRYWTGANRFVDLSFTGTSITKCRTVEIVRDHLVVGDVHDSSRFEHQISWSDTGNFNEFSTATTNAGSMMFTDAEGAIVRLVRAGDRLAVFTERSLATLTYVGGSTIFAAETLDRGVTPLSGNSVVDIGPFVLFADRENIFMFDGTRLVQPLGDFVSSELRDTLDHDSLDQTFAFHDNIDRVVYWMWPRVGSSYYIYSLDYNVYDVRDIRFGRIKFSNSDTPTCMGTFSRDTFISWANGGTDPWTDAKIAWQEGTTELGYPIKVVGTSNGKIFLWDDAYMNDDSEPIEHDFTTEQFVVPQLLESMLGRWLQVEFEAQGTDVELEVNTQKNVQDSTEGTFVSSSDGENKNVILDGDWKRYKIDIDATGQWCNVKFKNHKSNGWFKLRWIRAFVKAGGVR